MIALIHTGHIWSTPSLKSCPSYANNWSTQQYVCLCTYEVAQWYTSALRFVMDEIRYFQESRWGVGSPQISLVFRLDGCRWEARLDFLTQVLHHSLSHSACVLVCPSLIHWSVPNRFNGKCGIIIQCLLLGESSYKISKNTRCKLIRVSLHE